MRIEPLTVEHVERLRVQPAQREAFARMTGDYLRDLLASGPAWAATSGERVVAIAGLADHGGGRAMAWCFLADDLRHEMVALVRGIRRHLAACAFDRVELVTALRWPEAAAFARALGFTFEATLYGWCPPAREGAKREAALMWTRVRGA